jgi:ADP-ribose pyrophosphatase
VLQAAKRELGEETGYRAKKWTKLASFFVSPGFLEEKMTVYLAQDLSEGEKHFMEDERIETKWFSSREVDEMVRTGKIMDAKTMVGFLIWKRYVSGKQSK